MNGRCIVLPTGLCTTHGRWVGECLAELTALNDKLKTERDRLWRFFEDGTEAEWREWVAEQDRIRHHRQTHPEENAPPGRRGVPGS